MKIQTDQRFLSIILMLAIFFTTRVMAQSNELIIIDSNYSLKQQVLNRLPSDAPVLNLTTKAHPWETIRTYLEQNRSLRVLHLFAGTSHNAVEIGGIDYDSSKVDQEFELSMLEGLYQGTNIQLLIYDCTIGSSYDGLSLIEKISEKSYLNIAVPTNCTSVFSDDLEFDYTTMNQPINNSIFK